MTFVSSWLPPTNTHFLLLPLPILLLFMFMITTAPQSTVHTHTNTPAIHKSAQINSSHVPSYPNYPIQCDLLLISVLGSLCEHLFDVKLK